MNVNMPRYRPKPLILMVLDGLGVAPKNPGNAVTQAKTPNMNTLWQKFPHCYLQASGSSVGLPAGVNGNSEVGHMSIGAGKVIFQEIARIDKEIEDKQFFTNETFKQATNFVKQSGGKFHLMGLVSPGKVHSSMTHLYACLDFCKQEQLDSGKVFVHVFTDGRDVPPQSAKQYLGDLEKKLRSIKLGQIATVSGRYYAMDRDERWERTKLAYDAITAGSGHQVDNWQAAIEDSYKNEKTDEFIEPHVIVKGGQPLTTITPGDSVVFFNYRPDRAVQLTKAFENDQFKGWQRQKIENLFFAGFSNYEKGIPMNRAKEDTELPGGERAMISNLFKEEMQKTSKGFPEKQIFPPEKVPQSLGRMVADAGLKQLRITESEKYPHVTYFFNCREKETFPGEERIELPSPKEVETYDQKPEMSSYEVTNTLLQKINANLFDFILVNYAAPDMVGHTGELQATIKALEAVDLCLGNVVNAAVSKGGAVMITADHGNSEELVNLKTGKKDTEHSTNPVPFIYIAKDERARELPFGILGDIAPTVLGALGIRQPPSMVGKNLLL